jgi:hypothetical protein
MAPTGPEDRGRVPAAQSAQALDKRLELLANRDRRLVVSTLRDNDDDRLPVGVLTNIVARAHPDDVTPQSVLVDLHHVHLPKLQREGVVEYHADESLVVYCGDAALERCLRAIEDVAIE